MPSTAMTKALGPVATQFERIFVEKLQRVGLVLVADKLWNVYRPAIDGYSRSSDAVSSEGDGRPGIVQAIPRQVDNASYGCTFPACK